MGPKKRRSSTVAKASKAQRHPKKTKSQEVRDETTAPSKTDSSTVSEAQNTTHHIVADKAHQAQILEKGHIFFFYRPKVEHHEVKSIDDVQRLYMLLYPRKINKEDSVTDFHKRLILIGKKQLPDVHLKGRPFWGIVEKVGTHIEEVSEILNEEHYSTQTRGERTVDAARPCGEGVYAIVEHKGHTHLTYVLELPEELGDVQKAFRIEKEGSYIVSVRNPDVSSRAAFGFNKTPAKFPDELKQKFEGRRWCCVNPPSFLDYPGAEVLIISGSDDLKDEFGKVGFQIEEDERVEVEHLEKDSIFKELHMEKKEHPAKPLYTGKWE